MVQPVTDPAILAQLNAPEAPVTDPKILAQLNAPDSTNASNGGQAPVASAPSAFDDYMLQKGPFWNAVRSVMSQPSMQPFETPGDYIGMQKTTGDPMKDLVQTAKTIYEYPTRFLATTGLLTGPVGDKVAEEAGKAGIPPVISAALATAAGMAVNPLSYVGFKGGPSASERITVPPLAGAKAAANAAEAERFGINLTVGQAAQSKILGYLEAVGNRFPFSADNFNNFFKNELAQADGVRAKLFETLGQSKATEIVSKMEKDAIGKYLETATPEQATVLADKFHNIDAYMKKPMSGEFTQSMLAQQRKIALDKAGEQFDVLRDVVPPETPITPTNFSAQAKTFLDQELQRFKSDQKPSWMRKLSDYAATNPTMPDVTKGWSEDMKQLYQQQMSVGGAAIEPSGPMTFSKAQATMRALRDERLKNDPGYAIGIRGQGNTYAGYAAKLRQSLHDDMESSLGSLSEQAKQVLTDNPPTDPAIAEHLQKMTEVSDRWKQANANYAQTKEIVNDPFIIKLLKNDPEDFLDHAVTAKDISNVSKLKDLLGPDNFVPVKQNLLANMLVDKSGTLNPKSFVNKVDTIGYPTLTKVFDPDTLTEIVHSQKVFRDMKNLEASVGEGSPTAGLLMAKTALFGTTIKAYHLLMSGHPIAASSVLASEAGVPYVASKMYLSPVFRDIMLHAHTSPPAAAMALSVMAKGLALSGTAGPRITTNEPEPVPPQQ